MRFEDPVDRTRPYDPSYSAWITVFLLLATLFSTTLIAQEDLLNRGIQAFEEQNYEKAISLLSRRVSEDPGPRAFMYLGHAHYFSESYTQARTMYQKAEENGLPTAQADVYRARVTIAEGNPQDALETLRPLINHEEIGSLAVKLIARAFEKSDLSDLSAHVYRRIFSQESGKDAVLKKLYSLSMKEKEYNRASQYSTFLLQHNPLKPKLLLMNASSALKRGNVRTAEADLELARRLSRVDAELYRTIADIKTKRKNFPEAIHYYELLINAVDSPSPRDLYRLGISYLETDQFDEAERWLFRAAERKATYLSGVLRLIRRLNKNRPFQEVEKLLKKARNTFPDANELLALAGNLYLNQDAPERAFHAFNQLNPSSLNDRDTLYNYAYSAVKTDKREQALQVLTQGIARFPEHQPFRRLLDKLIE